MRGRSVVSGLYGRGRWGSTTPWSTASGAPHGTVRGPVRRSGGRSGTSSVKGWHCSRKRYLLPLLSGYALLNAAQQLLLLRKHTSLLNPVSRLCWTCPLPPAPPLCPSVLICLQAVRSVRRLLGQAPCQALAVAGEWGPPAWSLMAVSEGGQVRSGRGVGRGGGRGARHVQVGTSGEHEGRPRQPCRDCAPCSNCRSPGPAQHAHRPGSGRRRPAVQPLARGVNTQQCL